MVVTIFREIFFHDTVATDRENVRTRHSVCVRNGRRYYIMFSISYLSADILFERIFFHRNQMCHTFKHIDN
jgi:hypothetical protein